MNTPLIKPPLKVTPISIPGLREVKNGTLWHTITIPFGDYSGTQTFFNDYNGGAGRDSNVRNGSLYVGQQFVIKKISLMPSLEALPNDVNALMSNSHFSFDLPTRRMYEGPAQTFYKGTAKALDEIFLGIKKLPKKTQQAILENLKIPSGMELDDPGLTLMELQVFRATLNTPAHIKLKKPVKLTCLLEGMSHTTLY